MNKQKIKIKFTDEKLYEDFNTIKIGDWIDLKTTDIVTLREGQFKMIDLGVAMELPKGYEAWIVPRSSTFMKYGILQANNIGM